MTGVASAAAGWFGASPVNWPVLASVRTTISIAPFSFARDYLPNYLQNYHL
jgi:hypothetical protein